MHNRRKKWSVCPLCSKRYKGYPALSRTDGKTEICPICGLRQALTAFGADAQEQAKIIDSVYGRGQEDITE